jgi:hypothetical protein
MKKEEKERRQRQRGHEEKVSGKVVKDVRFVGRRGGARNYVSGFEGSNLHQIFQNIPFVPHRDHRDKIINIVQKSNHSLFSEIYENP